MVVPTATLIMDPAQELAVRKPSIHFSPAIPARNNRLFDSVMIGEKENRERSRRRTPPQNAIVLN